MSDPTFEPSLTEKSLGSTTTQPPEVVQPRPDAETPVLVIKGRRQAKLGATTPTDRIEARADRHIEELQNHNLWHRNELDSLRHIEELQNHNLWHRNELDSLRLELAELRRTHALNRERLVSLKVVYRSGINLSWFCTAIVALSGGVMGLAPYFDLADNGRVIATCAFAVLLIGVVLQALIDWNGSRALMHRS